RLLNNRLRHIKDSVAASNYAVDIDSQADDNYRYDAIGNLTKDQQEGIDSIEWTVYGKIKSITKGSRTISYTYDPAGNRISKTVGGKTTVYVRDAQGNVMAVYEDTTGVLRLKEQHLYGSSRLGMVQRDQNMDSAKAEGVQANLIGTTYLYSSERGQKRYELTNHLGNVLAVVSDKKVGVASQSDSSLIDHYEADVVHAQDYYPFGMLVPGRGGYSMGGQWISSGGGGLPANPSYSLRSDNQPLEYRATESITFLPGFESGEGDAFTAYITEGGSDSGTGSGGMLSGGGYRYGFNGKEMDNEVKGEGNQIDFGSRIYDPRTGRFYSVDPRIKEFPALSSYVYAADNPIIFIDEDGEGPKPAYDKTLEQRLNQRRLSTFVEVLKRCNNSSMYALEAWGWRSNPSQFNNDKIKGLAGEAIVVDYLRTMLLFTNERKTPNGRGRLAPQYIPQAAASQNIAIGGWDDDKTIDISFKLDLGNKGSNRLGITMPFNNADGSQINKGKGENYLEDVNFIIEVKTGTTISNFTRGFSQALEKSKGVANAVPVVAMDDDAYKDAIKESPGLKMYADQFIKNGGRIMLIDGLNKSAEKAASTARDEIRKGTNPYELKTGH
ncbi:MAG: hypothetical protein ICV79_05575, partial [Flavisolibacter sp.]|nr:hypothetical protein [Flavisolibacter sp.]